MVETTQIIGEGAGPTTMSVEDAARSEAVRMIRIQHNEVGKGVRRILSAGIVSTEGAGVKRQLRGKYPRRYLHEDDFPEPDLVNFPGHPLPSIAGQTEEQLATGMASQVRGLRRFGRLPEDFYRSFGTL